MSPATTSKTTAGATTRRRTRSQLLGKVGWRDSATDLSLTAAYADTDLNGNGLQEQRFLAQRLRERLHEAGQHAESVEPVQLHGSARIQRPAVVLGKRLLSRHQDLDVERRHQRRLAWPRTSISRRRPSRPRSRPRATRAIRRAARTRRTHRFPYWRCIANVLLNTEPNEKCNGLVQPHAHGAKRHRRLGPAHVEHRARRAPEPVHRRRGVRREPCTISRSHRSSATSRTIAASRPSTGLARSQTARKTPRTRSTRASTSTGRTHTISVFASDSVDSSSSVTLTVSGRYDRTDARQSRRDHAGRRAGLARRRSRLQPLQPCARAHVSAERRRSARTSATTKAAARRRRSSSAAPIQRTRAACRTRWPVIRRSIRS